METPNCEVNVDEILSDQAQSMINVDKRLQNENNLLVNPSSNFQHILLLYENENDLMLSINTYLNEGLNRNELCIHATVNLMNENYIKNFASQIRDYQVNRKEGNLLMFNLQPYYKKAVAGNLTPFDKLAKMVSCKLKKDSNDNTFKDTRITIDCANLLFRNGYFDQCTNLEDWLHQKPFTGSYLCVYPKSLFDTFPNDIFFSTLVQRHDVVVDTNGRKVTQHRNIEECRQ